MYVKKIFSALFVMLDGPNQSVISRTTIATTTAEVRVSHQGDDSKAIPEVVLTFTSTMRTSNPSLWLDVCLCFSSDRDSNAVSSTNERLTDSGSTHATRQQGDALVEPTSDVHQNRLERQPRVSCIADSAPHSFQPAPRRLGRTYEVLRHLERSAGSHASPLGI
jgi:hypothetical protein